MNDYRQEHLRRKQADAERRKEEATVAARRADRQRNAGLLAAIGVALLALLILAPMRFSAIAGEEVDPVKQYLLTHVSGETLSTADAGAEKLTDLNQVTTVVDPETAAIASEAAQIETAGLSAEYGVPADGEGVPAEAPAGGEVIEAASATVNSATDLTGNKTQAVAPVAETTPAAASVAIDFASGSFQWDADGDGQVETYTIAAAPQGGYVITRLDQDKGVATEGAQQQNAPPAAEVAIADASQIASITSERDAKGPFLTVGYLTGADGSQSTQCVVRLENGALVAAPSADAQGEAPVVTTQDAAQPQALQAAPEAEPVPADAAQVPQPEVVDAAAGNAAVVPEQTQPVAPQATTPAETQAPTAEPQVSAEDLFAAAVAEEQASGGIIGFAESVANTGKEQKLTSTDHQILVKYLIADSQFVGPETTIDSLMESEDMDLAFITQFANSLPLLDPGADSKSYIALVDTSKFTGYGTVTHADFAVTNTNAEILNEFATYDKETGIAYVPKKFFETDEIIAADNELPVQVQLLVSYDLAAKGTEDAGVEIPVSITSEIPGVVASQATSVFGHNFDTSITIPLVNPASAGSIGLDNILVYDGGSETPIDLTRNSFAAYDAETGELCIQMNAMSVSSLKVRIVGSDIASQIVDAVTKPTEAQAGISYTQMTKTWGKGNLKNININNAKEAINGKYVYRYDGPCLKYTKTFVNLDGKNALENAWIAATKEACNYLYAPFKAEYDTKINMATDIYLGGDLQKYDNRIVAWGAADRDRYFYSVKTGNGGGDIESGFALPGYHDKTNGVTVNPKLTLGRSASKNNLKSGNTAALPELDMSGLQPLINSDQGSMIIGTGLCCHITKPGETSADKFNGTLAGVFPDQNPDYGVNDNPNDLTQKKIKDYVYMRPLYLGYDKNNIPAYLVCGFVDATKGAQQACGIFSFAIEKPGYAAVVKTSANASVTDGNGNYADKMKGAQYGIYDSYAEAEAAGIGKTGKAVATVTFNGDLSVDKKPKSSGATLKPGTYWAKEIKAPTGYAANTAVLPDKNGLAVKEGQTSAFVTSDPPILGSVTVVKKDDETNKDVTQGSYDFTLYKSDKKTVVGTQTITAKGNVTAKWNNLPLGTYWVKETKATYPYMTEAMNLGEDKAWHEAKVTLAGKDISVTIKNHQRRGTAILNKIDEETQKGLGGAKFELYASQDVTSLDGTKRHTKDQKVKVKKTGEGTYVFDANSNSTELVSNNDGLIKVEGLYLNNADVTSFYMVETLPPSGFIGDTSRVNFDFKKDESKKVLEITQPKPNKPNGINIYTKDKRDDSNIADKVMGVWKKEDSVSVQTSASTDAMAIRTPTNDASYQPTLVPNGAAEYDEETAGATSASGTTLVVKNWFGGGNKLVLTARGGTDTITIDGVKSYPVAKTGVTYDIKLVDSQNKEVAKDSYSGPTSLEIKANTAYTVNATASGSVYKVEIKEGGTTNSGASVMTLAASAAASAASEPATEANTTSNDNASKAGGTVTATWDDAQKAWIAKDLVPGTKYKVVIGTTTVKVVSMSKEGGVVHFGRYATEATEMFAKGWLDQSGLANDDAKIVYKGKTNADGYVGFRRIPVGEYVIGEIKPPVDASGHYTYLVDTNAHNFKVNPQNNLIADTDDASKGYHDADAAKEVQYKSFLFKEDVTRLRLSKRSTTGGEEEVVGAKLVLTDADHVVVDEWTSTEEPHYIEGLAPGLYWLSEKETPQAYEWAEAVQIRLLPTGKVCHAVIYDTPLSVGVNVDKRQEIADPLDERVMENGDGKNEAALSVSPEGYYDYSLDVRSMSNSWLDELTMTDELTPATDGMARLVSIETPQAWQDYDGKMNVWYKTNKSSDRKSSRTTKSGYQVDDGSSVMPEGSTGATTEGSTSDKVSFKVLDGNPTGMSDADAKTMTDHNAQVFFAGLGSWAIQPKSGLYQLTFSDPKDLKSTPAPTLTGLTNVSDWSFTSNEEEHDINATSFDTSIKLTHASKTYTYTFRCVLDTNASGTDATTGSGTSDNKAPSTVSANATLSDGHVNSWLTNGTFALDPDGDKRLEDYKGWELWKEDLPTMSSTTLDVKSLDLADDEYVTAVRFEYGRVEAGFTTRPDGWDENIHRLHDDRDDIPNVSRMTFDAADASADAAAAQLRSLVDDLATKASRAAEKDLADRAASEKTKYEELVKSIAAYNADLTEDSELPRKFIDAIQVPAYAGEDEPGQKIAAAAESAKLSIQAVIETAQTAEGKIALSKSLPTMANKFKSLVSDETAQTLVQQVADFVKAVDLADPEGIATATEGIKASAAKAIDEVAATAMAGRVHYAPAIVHMQVTDKYIADCKLSNSASAIAARNGGGVSASDTTGETASGKGTPEDPEDPKDPKDPKDPEDPKDPKDPETPLLDRVSDTVEQSAKVRVMTLDTNLSAQDGSRVIEVENGKLPIADKVHYTGLTIGKEYVIKGEVHVRNGSDGDGIDGGVATNGGQPVANTVSFVPTAEEGDVLVPFTLDVAELQTRPAVAFETLYEGFSGKAGDVVLAEHKDINDPDQTMPVNPAASDFFGGLGADPSIRPSTPLAQTGDPVVIAAVAVLAGGLVVGFIIWHRRRSA